MTIGVTLGLNADAPKIVGLESFEKDPKAVLKVGLETKENVLKKVMRNVKRFIDKVLTFIRNMFRKTEAFILKLGVNFDKLKEKLNGLEDKTYTISGKDDKFAKKLAKAVGTFAKDDYMYTAKRLMEGMDYINEVSYLFASSSVKVLSHSKLITVIPSKSFDIMNWAMGDFKSKNRGRGRLILNQPLPMNDSIVKTYYIVKRDDGSYGAGSLTERNKEDKFKNEIISGDITTDFVKKFCDEAIRYSKEYKVDSLVKGIADLEKKSDDMLNEARKVGSVRMASSIQQVVATLLNGSTDCVKVYIQLQRRVQSAISLGIAALEA